VVNGATRELTTLEKETARMHLRFTPRYLGFALAALAAIGLSACNGGGSGVLGPITGFGPGGNSAQVRFVNGSPDAGPVQIFIDNQQQFCTSGSSGNSCTVAYGQATSYAVNLNAGSHAIVIKDSSGNQITLPSANLAVNSGFRYSVILAGEIHPSYGSSPTLQLVTTTEQPFNTPSGGAAANFHYAAPYVQSANGGPVQFGFFTANNPGGATLGQPVAFGTESTPQGIPSTGLNSAITFYAVNPSSGFTGTPSQFSSKCSTNSLPCDTGNASLYLVDGPAASTSPVSTLPAGVSASTHAFFIGAFDNNG
jgi:hypothetical protein